jgi:hypothetical protein
VSACVRVTQRPGGEVKQEVRTFATTTPELLALREWLSEQRVTHVAMEATGVYWKPIYYMLENDFEATVGTPPTSSKCPDARPTSPTARGWHSCSSMGSCAAALCRRRRFGSCATSPVIARA